MGNPRPKPQRLAEKLARIRAALGLSQTDLLKRLGLEEDMKHTRISEYELGQREPSLLTLLQYARVANVAMEALVDDELDIPDKLPSPTKSEGIKRAASARKRSRR